MSLATLLSWADASMAMTFAPASAAARVAGDARAAKAHDHDVGVKRLGHVAVGDGRRLTEPRHGARAVEAHRLAVARARRACGTARDADHLWSAARQACAGKRRALMAAAPVRKLRRLIPDLSMLFLPLACARLLFCRVADAVRRGAAQPPSERAGNVRPGESAKPLRAL